jgi:hypothetical protein
VKQSPEIGSSLLRGRLGFYGHFNTGLSGLFSLAMDSQAFLNKLIYLSLIVGEGTILTAFCSSAVWHIYQTLYLFFRMQE